MIYRVGGSYIIGLGTVGSSAVNSNTVVRSSAVIRFSAVVRSSAVVKSSAVVRSSVVIRSSAVVRSSVVVRSSAVVELEQVLLLFPLSRRLSTIVSTIPFRAEKRLKSLSRIYFSLYVLYL